MTTLLSIGHGYVAQHVAAALPDWHIIATTRDPARAETFRAQGWEPVLWRPGEDAPLRAAFAAASHVITSIAPVPHDPVLPAVAGTRGPRWLGYLGATSVYGDAGGDWRDETSPVDPGSARGRGRLAAEHGWQDLGRAIGAKVAVIRIAGIYGPGRSAFDALRGGHARRIIKPGQVFNRIHVQDLAQIIAAAARQQAEGPFIACDELPAPPQDVICHAAQMAGLPLPPESPYDPASLPPMTASFYAENKRLRSVRLHELGLRLRYPDYRAGLAGIYAQELAR